MSNPFSLQCVRYLNLDLSVTFLRICTERPTNILSAIDNIFKRIAYNAKTPYHTQTKQNQTPRGTNDFVFIFGFESVVVFDFVFNLIFTRVNVRTELNFIKNCRVAKLAYVLACRASLVS